MAASSSTQFRPVEEKKRSNPGSLAPMDSSGKEIKEESKAFQINHPQAQKLSNALATLRDFKLDEAEWEVISLHAKSLDETKGWSVESKREFYNAYITVLAHYRETLSSITAPLNNAIRMLERELPPAPTILPSYTPVVEGSGASESNQAHEHQDEEDYPSIQLNLWDFYHALPDNNVKLATLQAAQRIFKLRERYIKGVELKEIKQLLEILNKKIKELEAKINTATHTSRVVHEQQSSTTTSSAPMPSASTSSALPSLQNTSALYQPALSQASTDRPVLDGSNKPASSLSPKAGGSNPE